VVRGSQRGLELGSPGAEDDVGKDRCLLRATEHEDTRLARTDDSDLERNARTRREQGIGPLQQLESEPLDDDGVDLNRVLVLEERSRNPPLTVDDRYSGATLPGPIESHGEFTGRQELTRSVLRQLDEYPMKVEVRGVLRVYGGLCPREVGGDLGIVRVVDPIDSSLHRATGLQRRVTEIGSQASVLPKPVEKATG
jgi:hypothetical protein